MRILSISELCAFCEGKLLGPQTERPVKHIVRDNREVEEDFCFAAIKGERLDGHDFCLDAAKRGASCCITEKLVPELGVPSILVESVPEALIKIATALRQELSIPVVAVIGSSGKTTTKEMLYSVLSSKYKVLKNEGNYNNLLGVPLTIFRINPEHELAVLELGISEFGEMSRLAQIAMPDYAVFTSVDRSHTDNLHDLNGVLKAKSELFNYMNSSSNVYLSFDDKLLRNLKLRQQSCFYGTADGADALAFDIGYKGAGGIEFNLKYKGRELSLKSAEFGRHIVYAASAAAALAIDLGLSDDEIIRGVLSYKPVGSRARLYDSMGFTLIDDAYNANPESLILSLKSMTDLDGRKIAVLGDMYGLGEDAPSMQEECVDFALGLGIEVMSCGRRFPKGKTLHYESKEALKIALSKKIQKGDCVLVKASHASGFEEISSFLKELDLKA